MLKHGHIHGRSCGQGRFLVSSSGHRRGLFDEIQPKLRSMHLSSTPETSKGTELIGFEQDLFTMVESLEPDADYKVRIGDDYQENLRKLNKLLKPGGLLVLVH